MTAVEALRNGDLNAVYEHLKNDVRAEPEQAKHRIFLFQLLAVMGQWDRALKQLNVARDLDADALTMAQAYQEALSCEALRQQVFQGERAPLVFGEPDEWIALLIEAAQLTIQGNHQQAADLRSRAFEKAPATSGAILRGSVEDEAESAGEPFEWIADADSRLGPVLEAVVNGRYYWVPFCRISRIDIEPPADLRDMVWLPAHFQWANQGEAAGFIPTRYPASESSQDDAICLARKTDWTEPHAETFVGLGQRMLATDAADYALLDVRRISLNVE